MDNSETDRAKPGEPVFPRSHRLVRRLSLLYAACVLAVGALLLAALLPATFVQSRLLAQELIAGGLAALVLSALLLSLTGLLATLALTSARFRESTFVESGPASALSTRWRNVLDHPGVAARVGQAIIVPVGAILIYLATRLLWSSTTTAADSTAG